MTSGGRPCDAWTGTGSCGAPARLYPAGWRCADHAPARLAGKPEPPAAHFDPVRLDPGPAGPCRYCGGTAYTRDGDGPAHGCCHAWQAVIAAGHPCPSCQVAAIIARRAATGPNGTPRPVRLPALPPLPPTLPDGRPFVPCAPAAIPAAPGALKQARNGRRKRMIQAALEAAGRGRHVFPLRPGSKRPAYPDHDADHCARRDPRCRGGHTGWEPRATTDPARITRAWTRAPYNIGIACGPSRLVVVDLDVPKPGGTPPGEWDRPGIRTGADVLAALCDEAGQPYPADTCTVSTPSGGTHLYFTAPAGTQLRNTAGALGWLVDTRAGGGYVVGAASMVDGREYRITRDMPPAPLPGWLADRLRPVQLPPQQTVEVSLPGGRAGAYLRAAVEDELARVTASPPRGHNTALYLASIALGQLVAGGMLRQDDVTGWLTAAAGQAGQRAGETARTIASGMRAGAKRPRSVAA
jgi:hypothetical protein